MKNTCTAIVLAAGTGKRMGSTVQKQYLLLEGKPILYYSIAAFERQEWITDIVLVAGEHDIEYCRDEIVKKYGFRKVTLITAGGKERYHSVYNGLINMKPSDYVFIHDGARPFIDDGTLKQLYEDVRKYNACVPGVPVKDTIKIVDQDGYAITTPARDQLYIIQTPQTFSYTFIKEAYDRLHSKETAGITDDAMVAETMMGSKVKITAGSYYNIKITTPEDLDIAKIYINQIKK